MKSIDFRKKPPKKSKLATISKLTLFFIVCSLTSYFVANELTGIQVLETVKVVDTHNIKNDSLVMNSDLIRIEGTITQSSMRGAKSRIMEQYVRDPQKPIRILINSPGGSVFAGRTFIDLMEMVSNPIECHVVDMAASMAAMIFMHCDKKYMMPSSFLLFHQMSVAIPTHTQIREIERDIEFWKQYWKDLVEAVALRMGLTYEELYVKLNNTWMLTAKESKKLGFIDGYITDYKCDKQDDECVDPLYELF